MRRAVVLLTAVLLTAPTALVAAPGGPDAGLDRYRQGHVALAGGDFAAALAQFESVPTDSILADYAAFFAAETLLRAGDEAPALERFRVFLERFPDSVLAPQAVLALGDTAFRLGRWAEGEREARRFLKLAPQHPEAGRILVRLAVARAAQGLVAEAIADLRRRWIEAPASPWGEVARELAEDLAGAHGLPFPPLGTEDRLLQAQRLIDASDFAAAARGLEELTAQAPEPAIRHKTLVMLAPALGRLQRGAEAIVLLEAALAEPPTAWRAALLAELGRLYRRTGQPAAAVPVLERLVAEHPDSPLVPDAWLALARARLELGQAEAARGAFQALIKAFPDTPAAASAQWELGWHLYRAGLWRDAALTFRQLSASAPSFRLAGLYWAARALEAAAEKGAATALYRELVSRSPHTYYGILAARRTRGTAPAPVAARVRLAADPIALLEPDRHFQKGRALWRLGFEGHALGELEALGREVVVDADRAWSLGVAFAQIGESGRSLRYLRRAFGGAAEAGAPGLTEQFWRLFYPFGHAEIVKDAARRVGLDPFFVAAVIREESSYDARARSWVGAVGLMQLMPETARLVAADAGVRLSEPAGLWEPPVNIVLGAHYLAQLRSRFQEPLLAVAGYNAGPHRVRQWLAARRTADLEEFVDQIPFDETRAFVKRVFASWHHYRRLYAVPERPLRRGEAEATPRLLR
ncbi:MAG: tetratricopeptide repeat protein [Candidatus Rokubacteria bacterium]|nr:tetratricopeptide repeat protein [Candidatus Rokubacteria bacterium]